MSVDWFTTLVRCGCSTMTAQNWAPIFAVEAHPSRFSRGDEELDDFLAQVLHESAMLTRVEESLHYRSAERIQTVWPSRFPSAASAARFVANPEALANFVYGGRNGNTDPGDGWKYRGRGLIQVTGKSNYTQLAQITGLPLVDFPDMLRRSDIALRASVLWWEGNVPDSVMGDVVRVTRRVNGGTVGMDHRRQLAAKTDLADGKQDGRLA